MDQGNHLKRVPFILVTGFLGSGKTSLLLDLINKYSHQLQIAIVQNEFTPGHADALTLKRSSQPFEILEINNGSVFCACLLGDFIDKLGTFIHKYQPDLILLEATGLADPVALGQMLQSPELADKIYLAGSWCLVDALNFHKVISSVSRARHQIRIADIVWINKTDLIPNTDEICDQVRQLNPFATIMETSFGCTDQLSLPDILSFSLAPDNQLFPGATSEPRPQIASCVFRSNRYFNEIPLKEFIVGQAQKLYRMKGYLRLDESRTLAIQTVFDDISTKIILDYQGPDELIAIGPDLNKLEFSKQLVSLEKR